MARSANMQSMTNDITAVHPGVVIYGKGDPAHQESASDHNEDDTPGSKPAQSDSDNKPEHRAIDVMIGPAFTKEEAYAQIEAVLADPTALARLDYIIFDGWIWSRSYGWRKRAYSGKDKHTNHIHYSGIASDDENGASWPAIYNGKGGNGMFCQFGQKSEYVRYLQWRMTNCGVPNVGEADGDYGNKTAAAVAWVVMNHDTSAWSDGKNYGALEMLYLDVRWSQHWGGKQGPAGPPGKDGTNGKDGAPGKDAILQVPPVIHIEATVTEVQK